MDRGCPNMGSSGGSEKVTREDAINFLEEAARYFENRDTKGEDAAYWSNVYNATNCRKIVELLKND